MVLHRQYNASRGVNQPAHVTTFVKPKLPKRRALTREDRAIKTDGLIFTLLLSAIDEHDIDWLVSGACLAVHEHLNLPLSGALFEWIEEGCPDTRALLDGHPDVREAWLKTRRPSIESLLKQHYRDALYRPDHYIPTPENVGRKHKRHGSSDSQTLAMMRGAE